MTDEFKPPLVHAIKPGQSPWKWSLGKALCNRTIGRYTPTSDKPEDVTCKTCLKRKIAGTQEDRS